MAIGRTVQCPFADHRSNSQYRNSDDRHRFQGEYQCLFTQFQRGKRKYIRGCRCGRTCNPESGIIQAINGFPCQLTKSNSLSADAQSPTEYGDMKAPVMPHFNNRHFKDSTLTRPKYYIDTLGRKSRK